MHEYCPNGTIIVEVVLGALEANDMKKARAAIDEFNAHAMECPQCAEHGRLSTLEDDSDLQ